MFSDLTHEELNVLYATLGSGADEAGRRDYHMASEIGQAREDVHRAIADVTRAEFAERTARAEAEPELGLF
jgi:hypothetical protein